MTRRSRSCPRIKRSIGEIAMRWGVANRKVRGFIDSGELKAMNIASSTKVRPVLVVDIADLEAFERKRQAIPTGDRQATQRVRRQRQTGVTNFFEYVFTPFVHLEFIGGSNKLFYEEILSCLIWTM